MSKKHSSSSVLALIEKLYDMGNFYEVRKQVKFLLANKEFSIHDKERLQFFNTACGIDKKAVLVGIAAFFFCITASLIAMWN